MDLKEGQFKARGIKGSEQYGEAGKGTLQLAINLDVPELQRSVTTFLFFSTAAAPFSIERLRALGWKGKGWADIQNLDGIDANEVNVRIKKDVYQGKFQWRVEIQTGGGVVTLEKPVDKASFAARLAAMMGGAAVGVGTAAGSEAGGKDPWDLG